jgi:hypothetical protein
MNCGSGSAKYGFGSLLLFLIMRLEVLTFFFQNEILILSLSLPCLRACAVACRRARLRERVTVACARACVRACVCACVRVYVLSACVRPSKFTILFVPHSHCSLYSTARTTTFLSSHRTLYFFIPTKHWTILFFCAQRFYSARHFEGNLFLTVLMCVPACVRACVCACARVYVLSACVRPSKFTKLYRNAARHVLHQ